MQNKILVSLAVLLGLLLLVLGGNEFLVNKITDRVIDKLKRDYVPGPYDPGFDPDKVNPSAFRSEYSTTQFSEWKQNWEDRTN
jgi:hypothetical protein